MTEKFEIHMHSTHSDGEFSPQELIALAKKNDVKTLALTDHDTFSGVEEFVEAGKKEGIFAFPGIEITVAYRDFNLHLLGYFKDPESIKPEFLEKVEAMKKAREVRMHELIARVDEALPEKHKGTILFENVVKSSEGVLARPHLAREMVRLGIVKDVRDAFDTYLVKHNIEKKNLHVFEAIKEIRQSNGVPVLAHPGERSYSLCNPEKGRPYSDVPKMLEELKSHGLLGIECVYPYHERIGKVDYFLSLAKEWDLIATGSRDFHGSVTHQKPSILGTTKMDPAPLLTAFQAAWLGEAQS